MKLKTEIPVKKQHNPINYDSHIILIGSCFSDNIGKKLEYYKFNTTANPNGIMFNPISIENAIDHAVTKKQYTKDDVIPYDGLWHSFYHHSTFSGPRADPQFKNENVLEFHEDLKKATHIFVTLGTAWVYRYLKTNEIVANCHKIPQKEFKKELLSVKEIEKSLQSSIHLIKSNNPDTSIIFTVSPVRHIKDGFTENQLSKAYLLSAVHQVVGNGNASYFPAYEIMMDELRDYRFYKRDMLHPNKLAIEYIWEKFVGAFMRGSTLKTMSEIEKLQKEIAHRPIHPMSDSHKKFKKTLEKKLLNFRKNHPKIEL